MIERSPFRVRAAGPLDLLTFALLALAAAVVLFGGIRFFAGNWRISATSTWRLLALAALVAGARHVLLPRPAAPARALAAIASARAAIRSTRFRAVAPIWLVTRLGVLVVAFLAVATIGVAPQAERLRVSGNPLWNLPYRWDTGWYLAIAVEGYQWNPAGAQQRIAFFPAFPMLMRGGGAVLGGRVDGPRTPASIERLGTRTLVAGWLLALAASLAALFALYTWACDLGGRRVAIASVALLSTYPFALYFSAAYTEPFFLLATISAFNAVRSRRAVTAGAWGLFMGLVRPNGFLVALPLMLMAWQQRSRDWRLWMATVMPGVGVLIFSAYLMSLTGRPLVWLEAHASWGRTPPTWEGSVAQPLQQLAQEGAVHYALTEPYQLLNGAALLFAIALLPAVWRRLGAAPALFAIVMILPPLFAGGLMSMGRITATVFPLFVALAAVVPRRRLPVWLVLFALVQGLAAALFFTWRPLV